MMKIKTVCDITGLTDRTIRYYIEEQLISPAYTENYIGRKSYDFSQEDVDTLKSISTLRKFDFSIEEIRQIINDESLSSAIISKVKQRTETSVSIGKEKLNALSQLNTQRNYTLLQLADELSKPTIILPATNEPIKRFTKKNIILFIEYTLALLGVGGYVVFCILATFSPVAENRYPIFNFKMILLTIVCIIPFVVCLCFNKIKWKKPSVSKQILSILMYFAFFLFPLFTSNIIAASETSSIYNYRNFDADCIANNDLFLQELLPINGNFNYVRTKPDGSQEFAIHQDAHYYYYHNPKLDSTYDIYAQWPLEQDEFDQEVARVQDLFSKKAADSTMEYEVIRKGNYNCIILYESFYPVFEDQKLQYEFYIFAYDENRTIIRYIACVSDDPRKHQPYHLTLEW